MLKYNALIVGLGALAVWALIGHTLARSASNTLIAVAILCLVFGAIAHKPAAQKVAPKRKRRRLSASERAARDARKALNERSK